MTKKPVHQYLISVEILSGMENHAWNAILAVAAKATDATYPTQRASYYLLSRLQCDISCHLGYVWWHGEAINIRVEYLFLSDRVGQWGPRVLLAVAIFTLLKCGSTPHWDSITCHTLTPSPPLMNAHTHRAQFSHPCQYPKAWSWREGCWKQRYRD